MAAFLEIITLIRMSWKRKYHLTFVNVKGALPFLSLSYQNIQHFRLLSFLFLFLFLNKACLLKADSREWWDEDNQGFQLFSFFVKHLY